ncbi:hypothetical protein [Streptomyces virginiae]|uniref:hypothetical protein n=1 Tax=Streptomyces virginiae TaxID=1961 RepID=UPI0033203EA7
MSIDQMSWEAAVRHLYEDAFTFSATGPRNHEDWQVDVLAVMEDRCTLRNLERFSESFEELQEMARTILARYGDAFTCHTNVSTVGHVGRLDFGGQSVGWTPMTFYGEDCGLVVVSDTEVGLFWTFGDV